MPRPKRKQRSLTKRHHRTAQDNTRQSPNKILPSARYISAQSSSPVPTVIQGTLSALVALDPNVSRDVRDFVIGKVKAVSQVGHELIKPTGEKFVFFLRPEEQEDKLEIRKEVKQELEEFIDAGEDGEVEHGKSSKTRPRLVKKDDQQIRLPVIEKVDEDVSLQVSPLDDANS